MKKIIARILIIPGIILASLFTFVIISGWMYSKDFKTPPLTDNNGQVVKNSIALCEKKEINGWPQYLLMRGKDASLPVLLFLHGGPGISETSLLRSYNSELENHFIMVYWDQRGTGRSYSPFIDKKTLTIDQFVSDTHELIIYLKKKFNKNKIFLAGHSWGSFLGVLVANKYPEDLYCYIGIGQIVNLHDSEKISYDFIYKKAKAANDQESIYELDKIKGYPDVKDVVSATIAQRLILVKYGGVIYNETSYQNFFKKVNNPESSIFAIPILILGTWQSLESLWIDVIKYGDFRKINASFKIPVYLLIGKHDYNVPFILSESYFNKISAPYKKLVWFETAHFIPFEDPKTFNTTLIAIKNKIIKP
jgi:pimeloyl-ACP methyl ester carboxylesterase